MDLQKHKGAFVSVCVVLRMQSLYMTFNKCFVNGEEAECVVNQIALLIGKDASWFMSWKVNGFCLFQSPIVFFIVGKSPDKIVRLTS